jgi:AmmeMemoRadiSam system protein A
MPMPPTAPRGSIATQSTLSGRSPRRLEAKPIPGFLAGALVAHPPILLTEVGGAQSARVRVTADAMHRLDGILSAVDAALVVVVSPHSPSSMTSLPVRRAAHAAGDLSRFRAPQIRVEAQVDVALAAALVVDGQRAGFSLTWAEESELDHGVVVPLYALARTMANKRCIFLGVSGWPLHRFVEFGAWLQGRLQDRSAILIASGDLSHRLTPDAPYGFRPEGPVFDRKVIDALRARAWEQIEALDPDLVEEAGECGLRPLAILLGAGRAAHLNSEVLSYEGPFGVGYPVVAFTAADTQKVVLDIQALGRHAIDTYLRTRQLIQPPEPIPVELQAPSAVFVTLRKHGELRGCVGSVRPTEATAAHELIRYAVASAVRDPRFDPVRLDEVSALTIKVQLLDPPEPVSDIARLDPHTYGVIVRHRDRQALLLPDIEGIDTAEQQVLAACQKAGIDRRAPLELERFRTRTLE